MNSAIDVIIGRSRTVLTIMIVTLIAGLLAYIAIPKEAEPDIPIPIIYISVPYPGISPEDAERLIVKPLEVRLRTVEGVKQVSATAAQNFANVILEFDVNFDKEKALQDVREQVDIARAEIPAEAEEPIISEINISLQPIITVNLSGDVPERTLVRLAKELRDEIEMIPSVLDAEISGMREELLEVVIDPAKLAAYSVTQTELFSAVARNNQLVAAGSLDTGRGRFSVKVPGLFETSEDVLGLPIKVSGDTVVTLGEIADIRRTFWDPTSFSRLNGKPGISINVTKRIGENIIQTTDLVRRVVAEAQKQFPDAVDLTISGDQSRWIHSQIGSLESALITAVVLVMIIVVAALGLRSAALVGVTIPTSFLLTFILLSALGFTLNFMVMFGLVLAVGILVDGGIIIVEYADRKMGEGFDAKTSYALASKRMFWPVTASTMTTCAAFLPMLFWPDVVGKFMSYLPITLIIVLSASLVSALVFLPVMGAIFGRPPKIDAEAQRALEISETGDLNTLPGITGRYARLLMKLIRHPIKVIMGTVAIVIAVLVAFAMFNSGVEFFITEEPDFLTINVQARGNLSIEESEALVVDVESRIIDMDGFESVLTRSSSGRSGFSFGGDSTPVDTIGTILIELKDHTERAPASEIMDEIRSRTANIPGIIAELQEVSGGIGGGKDVQIELRSDFSEPLFATADLIRQHLDADPELVDVEDTRPLPGIEWQLDVDRENAGRFGADVAAVGAWVQLVTNGIFVGTYRPADAEDEVDIRVRFPLAQRGLGQLDELLVQTQNGLVPITNFVTRKPKPLVDQIDRVDAKRILTLRANAAEEVIPFAKINELKSWLQDQNIDPQVSYVFRGNDEDQAQSMNFLMIAFVSALALIAVVLLTQFNNFYHTFLILVAVFLAMVGVFLGMLISRQMFSIIMTGTGIVALAGVVINHNIVLIDTYHRLREAGFEAYDAIVRTGAQRLRPVFLTSIVTILGLLPLAFHVEVDFFDRHILYKPPAGAMWVQLATAVVWGLLFAKPITLVLTPCLLALPEKFRKKGAIPAKEPGRFGAAFHRLRKRIGLEGLPPEPTRPMQQPKAAE